MQWYLQPPIRYMRFQLIRSPDPNLVPSAMLPLQDILAFSPATAEDASEYLQCMTISEGYMSSTDHMCFLYKASHKTDALDATDDLSRARSMAANGNTGDLRQAINNLQFLCQAVPGFEDPISAPRHIDDASELLAGTLDLEYAFDALRDRLSVDMTLQGNSERSLGLLKLWRISEALSAVDGELARSPGDILKVRVQV